MHLGHTGCAQDNTVRGPRSHDRVANTAANHRIGKLRQGHPLPLWHVTTGNRPVSVNADTVVRLLTVYQISGFDEGTEFSDRHGLVLCSGLLRCFGLNSVATISLYICWAIVFRSSNLPQPHKNELAIHLSQRTTTKLDCVSAAEVVAHPTFELANRIVKHRELNSLRVCTGPAQHRHQRSQFVEAAFVVCVQLVQHTTAPATFDPAREFTSDKSLDPEIEVSCAALAER